MHDTQAYICQLTLNNLHTSTCLTPWAPSELCIECFAPSPLDDVQQTGFEPTGSTNHNAVLSIKTYAQVAAWSTGYDEAQEPIVDSMPPRRPRATSAAESARLAMQSQCRGQLGRPKRQRQIRKVSDVVVDPNDSVPTLRRQRPTYAEVAQQKREEAEPFDEAFGSHFLFTSTENSMGLPNQNICRTPHQPPYRTPRTPISYITPYPAAYNQSHISKDVHIATLTQAERTLDPRDPYTLVQRTGRGGHRQPLPLNLSIPGALSPLSCGTLSTVSSDSRTRRKEVQDRPHPCLVPGCSWRFVNPKDLKRSVQSGVSSLAERSNLFHRHGQTHTPNAIPAFPCPYLFCIKSFTRHDNRNRHIRSEHGDDSGLGSSRGSSEYASVSHSSFPQM